jgi:hypothetical protein
LRCGFRRGKEEKLKKGDAVSVRCKTHGNRKLVAGADFPLETPRSLIRCPYCQATKEIKPPGFGFTDSKGVAYICDWTGRFRILSRLNEAQKRKIQAAKKEWLEEQRKLAFEKEKKSGSLIE